MHEVTFEFTAKLFFV